jgi:hypothetical protein
MDFSKAFGEKFAENKDLLRIRSFELNGHTFKVKVPLTSENEAMYERTKVIDEAKAQQFYDEMAKEILANPDKYKDDPEIEFQDSDIIVKGISLKETSRNKVLTQNRITEMVRLLVPENKDFDMSSISYQDIDDLFPFSVQMELLEEINNTISPSYAQNRKK